MIFNCKANKEYLHLLNVIRKLRHKRLVSFLLVKPKYFLKSYFNSNILRSISFFLVATGTVLLSVITSIPPSLLS